MAALENSKQIYSDIQQVSATTNRPVDENNPEPTLPGFYCISCDVKLEHAMQAIQHFHSKAHILKKASAINSTPGNLKRKLDSSDGKSSESNGNSSEAKQAKTDGAQDENELYCKLCNNSFNSKISAEQHFRGRKHQNAVAELTVSTNEKTYHKVPVAQSTTNIKGQSLAKYHCTFCDIALNSDEQMTQHCNGIRHKLKAGQIKEPPTWWVDQQTALNNSNTKRASGKGVGDPYKCEVCDIFLNSQIQLGQHLSSAKHKERAELQNITKAGIAQGRGRGRGRGRGTRGATNTAARGGGGGARGGGGGGGARGGGSGRGGANDKSWYTTSGVQRDAQLPEKSNPNYMPLNNSRLVSYGSLNPPFDARPVYGEPFVSDTTYDLFY